MYSLTSRANSTHQPPIGQNSATPEVLALVCELGLTTVAVVHDLNLAARFCNGSASASP